VRWENDTEDVQELVRPKSESAMVEALFGSFWGMEAFKKNKKCQQLGIEL
jgi:hypothetical protein